MKRLTVCAVVLVGVFLFAGCERDSGAEFSSDEIANALGMQKWEVTLPADHDKNATVWFALKYRDGTVDNKFGSSHWDAGAVLKVIIWPGEKANSYRTYVSDGDKFGRGTVTVPDDMAGTSVCISTNNMSPGDTLMKFSNDSVTGAGQILEGEVGVILNVSE